MARWDIIKGTNKSFIAFLTDDTGAAIDLTGYSTLKLYVASSLATASASLTLNKTLSPHPSYAQTQGVVFYAFVPGDTSSVSPASYRAEVEVVYLSGITYVSPHFTFIVNDKVKA